MKDLLDRLSSYNVVNYLLPGVLFAYLVDAATTYRLLQADLIVGVFLYYFLGAVVSRVGSLVVEPLLLRMKFVTFAPYSEYVAAARSDGGLSVLSEVNNMYRSFCGVVLSVAVVFGYHSAAGYFPALSAAALPISLLSLFVLFLFAYRKQTDYIRRRVSEGPHEPGQVLLRG